MLSIATRSENISKLRNEVFDLLVIGGGITGAGIALDAASRGLKTALVEKHDFAFGTSSRSTKLIHGGLRYLKQLEFGLVKEVGSERAVVHQLAPHLVLPEKMLLPLYEKRGFGSILTSFGLKLYDWLAGVLPEDQRRMLTRKETLKCEPLLRPSDIKGGAIYAEYRTDDARLTIEIIKTGFDHGALPVNYCTVTGFVYEAGKATGAHMRDEVTGESFDIKAKVIVNATGPWVDELREADNSKKGKRLHLTKGVHIVLPRGKLAVQQAIYFDVGDGRMIFAIPRGRTTYVGTTDTNYDAGKEVVVASKADVDYLIDAINKAFDNVNLTVADIESTWAGLRPLIHEEGKSASELSRKDEIFESQSGLISIAGGKLTGYRKMAERVVDLVIDKYFKGKQLKACHTSTIRLTGSAFANAKEVEKFREELTRKLPNQVSRYGSYLTHNYGVASNDISASIRQTSDDASSLDTALIIAELEHAMNNEMVVSASDFFIRRTGLLFFNIERMKSSLEAVLAFMQKRLGWTEDKVQEERQRLKDSIKLSGQFL